MSAALASDELAITSLVAAARELPLPACRELGRRINEFVLFEAQAEEHSLGTEVTARGVRYVGALRSVAEVHGAIPASTDYLAEYKRRRDLGDERLPSLSSIVKFFGGWEAALAAAALTEAAPVSKVERIRGRKGKKVHRYADARLIEALRACARDIRKPPTVLEYKEWREDKLAGRPGRRAPGADIPHFRTIHARFGSWLNALRAAGFADPVSERARTRIYSAL